MSAAKHTPRRRFLKEFGKRRLLLERDRLAERAAMQERGSLVLAGLQSVAWQAGREHHWVHEHIYGMAERSRELVRYGREAHFVPHGQPHVRSTGAQA